MPRGGEAVPGEGGVLLPLLLCIRRTGEERAAGNAQVAPPRRVHASRSQSRRELAAISLEEQRGGQLAAAGCCSDQLQRPAAATSCSD